MKRLSIILSCAALVSTASFAGDREGNGGYGLKREGRVYLLDLVENGVEKAPVFESEVRPTQVLGKRLSSVLRAPPAALERLAQKIAEIHKADALLGEGLLRSFELYQWMWVHDDLIDVGDYEGVPIQFHREDLVPIALRQGRTVRIHEEVFAQLDANNQAALLLHEALYALLSPKIDEVGPVRRSVRARELIGYFFSDGFHRDASPRAIARSVGDDLPSLGGMLRYMPPAELSDMNVAFPGQGFNGREVVWTWPRVEVYESGDEDHPLSLWGMLRPTEKLQKDFESFCATPNHYPLKVRFAIQGVSINWLSSRPGTPLNWFGYGTDGHDLGALVLDGSCVSQLWGYYRAANTYFMALPRN